MSRRKDDDYYRFYLGETLFRNMQRAENVSTDYEKMLDLVTVPKELLDDALNSLQKSYTSHLLFMGGATEPSWSDLMNELLKCVVMQSTRDHTHNNKIDVKHRLRVAAQVPLRLSHPEEARKTIKPVADFSMDRETDTFEYQSFLVVNCKESNPRKATRENLIQARAVQQSEGFPLDRPIYGICFGREWWILLKLIGDEVEMTGLETADDQEYLQLPQCARYKVTRYKVKTGLEFMPLLQVLYSIAHHEHPATIQAASRALLKPRTRQDSKRANENNWQGKTEKGANKRGKR